MVEGEGLLRKWEEGSANTRWWVAQLTLAGAVLYRPIVANWGSSDTGVRDIFETDHLSLDSLWQKWSRTRNKLCRIRKKVRKEVLRKSVSLSKLTILKKIMMSKRKRNPDQSWFCSSVLRFWVTRRLHFRHRAQIRSSSICVVYSIPGHFLAIFIFHFDLCGFSSCLFLPCLLEFRLPPWSSVSRPQCFGRYFLISFRFYSLVQAWLC